MSDSTCSQETSKEAGCGEYRQKIVGFQKGPDYMQLNERHQKRLCEVTFLAVLGGRVGVGWRENGSFTREAGK